MRVWRFTLVSLLFVSCVPSPAELCRRGVEQECRRQFECQSAEVKASPGFQGGWGISLDECVTKVALQAGCADKATLDALCTGPDTGKHFDLSKASQCSSERDALSCAAFLDPAQLPASCSERCR